MNFSAQAAQNISPLLARLFIAIVLFPHGAQKLMGWWDGAGFHHTMEFFSDTVGLPYVIGVMVIIIEFFGPIFLLLGLATRAWASAVMIVMCGVIVTVQHKYFFMNWFNDQQGEGMEFFLLMIGLCTIALCIGGGRWSLDHKIKFSRAARSNQINKAIN